MLFKGKSNIGFDIGSSYLKVASVIDTKSGYELAVFDVLPLPPALIVDGSIMDSLRLIDSIKELIKKSKIKIKNAVISISGHSSVIIKRISLPEMTEEELSESIKFEAEQYVPFEIDDVNLDFQILGLRQEPGQMDVLLVAVKKDIISDYVNVVREAGLNPVIVDIDAFAMENIYEINYEIEAEKNIALINIGANSIIINILRNGVSVFTRDSSIGSNLYTEALQREFQVPYEIAEKLKKGEPVENVSTEEADSVIKNISEDILAEIVRSLDYFREAPDEGLIDEVILSGGGALIEEFKDLLSERAGIDVSIIEPFRNIRIPKKFDNAFIEEMAPVASIALGLALRRIGDR